MLRPMDSPNMTHDDHLRRLLDQRAARADFHHGRFPSITEFSDSPSVYSHAYFSPRPIDRAELDAHTSSFNFAIPSQYRGPHEPRTHIDRDRLNDPSASTLDLDDDSTSSRPNSQTYDDDVLSPEQPEGEEEEVVRMSMLGPKMRMYSPAPWEMEEDAVEEAEEPDDDARSFVSKRGKVRNKGEGFMKGFNLSSLNGRNQSAPRPSTESRSSGKEKKSFETSSSYISSSGALHALAQASMSSTSLAPSNQGALRAKFSLPGGRTRTMSNSTSAGKSMPSPRSFHFPAHSVNTSSPPAHSSRPSSPAQSFYSAQLGRTDTRTSSRADSPVSRSSQDYVHPYANPDLMYRNPVHLSTHGSRSIPPPDMPNSESSITFPDSNTTRSSSPSRSASAATITMTPDTSTSSFCQSASDTASLKRQTAVQSRAISSPIPVETSGPPPTANSSSSKSKRRETKLFPPTSMNQLAGWGELPASPTFTLISLQEAQAQARDRSRSNTVQAPSHASKAAPFLDMEPPSRYASNPSTPVGTRPRARSTSAGSKAKMALQSLTMNNSPSVPPRTENESSPGTGSSSRGLKHKRSGFMRLFNGKEKEKVIQHSQPPPVPSISDAGTSSHSVVPKTPKITSARVPVPSLSPVSPQDAGSRFDDMTRDAHSGTGLTHGRQERSPMGRRNIPPLSIIPPSDKPSRLAVQSPITPQHDDHPRATLSINGQQSTAASAPASTTEFPSLSLRPVSTIFSAHFSEHLVDGDSPTDVEFSPLTPGFSTRSAGDKATVAMAGNDDSPAVVQALQEQIATSRRAWQQQIWELEGQVRDLRAEVDDLRAKEESGEHCAVCGRGGFAPDQGADVDGKRKGVVNRPRARTGVGTRFGAATC